MTVPPAEAGRRLPRLIAGLACFGVGIALMVLGDLGLGPWDVFHQGLADLTGLGMGTIIALIGVALVFIFIPLGEVVGIGTVLNAVLIGLVVDLTLGLMEPPSQFLLRIALMISGPVLIAIGSGLYIGAGLGPGPRDGIMTGLAKRGVPVARARTGIEVLVLILGLLLGGTIGVGTVWFAFGIGPMVGYFLRRLSLPPVEPRTATLRT